LLRNIAIFRCSLALSLFFVAISTKADAQDTAARRQIILILSEGMSTCGEYIAEPWKQSIRMEWVLGYISGANSRSPPGEASAGSSFQMPATVLGWLQSYCTSHPLDVMASAAEALRRDFLSRERPAMR
jgi:hypothetical protein